MLAALPDPLTGMTKLVTRLNAHAKQQPRPGHRLQAESEGGQGQLLPPTKIVARLTILPPCRGLTNPPPCRGLTILPPCRGRHAGPDESPELKINKPNREYSYMM